jgi:hypothetical protein
LMEEMIYVWYKQNKGRSWVGSNKI